MDPSAGNERFGDAAEAFIASSALNANQDSRTCYLSNYRANVKARFAGRTLAQMATAQASEDVTELVNVTMAGKGIGARRIARMIICGTIDAAVRAEKIGQHKLSGINLTRGAQAGARPATYRSLTTCGKWSRRSRTARCAPGRAAPGT